MGALVLVTGPAAEPVSTAEAKTHFRVDHSSEDTLIESLVKAARSLVEKRTGRSLITQTHRWELDGFPCRGYLLLPRAPVQSVTEIRYFGEDDDTGTVIDADDYIVDTGPEPARIVLKRNVLWPTATLEAARGIRIPFVSGYGAAGASVPEGLKIAIKMMAATWYEHREELTREDLERVPDGMDALLAEFEAWNAFGHASVHQEGARG